MLSAASPAPRVPVLKVKYYPPSREALTFNIIGNMSHLLNHFVHDDEFTLLTVI